MAIPTTGRFTASSKSPTIPRKPSSRLPETTAPTPRAPPDVDGLVLELDAAYSASSIDSSDQVDQCQELTYVDIDTFLASF